MNRQSNSTLSALEIAQITSRCPSLAEPWFVTPALVKLLEDKRQRGSWRGRSPDAIYRNRPDPNDEPTRV